MAEAHRSDGIDVLKQKDKVREGAGIPAAGIRSLPESFRGGVADTFCGAQGHRQWQRTREVVQALLQQTNLYEHRRKPLGSFSGGMKQRFGIAQALLGNPRLIIVDEPTAGLDPEERVRFHNLLSAIGENIIVILSTHIVSDVSDLCGRMAIIHQGRVLVTGDCGW